MESNTEAENCCNRTGWQKMNTGGCSGAVYALGFIGAAVYYIQLAPTFWIGAIGLLKAAVWPAFVVYYALTYFGI